MARVLLVILCHQLPTILSVYNSLNMRATLVFAAASFATGAIAARSMGYCQNLAGDGGDIGKTRFCCDSQFDFRFSEVSFTTTGTNKT